MEPSRKPPRMHSRKELADVRPPVVLACVVVAVAVLIFAGLSQLLS